MTTLYSHNHHPHPPPLDQPTPQSPPFYMSANHATSSTTTTSKFHSSVATGVSPPHTSPLTSSFSSNSRQLPITTTTNTIPTPASSAAGTVPATTSHEDTDGDLMMEDDDNMLSPNKRRRTSNSSYDRSAPTAPPALRQRNTASGYMPDASPPIPTEQELLSQPDVSTYYLVCPKPHLPSHPDLTDNLLVLYGLKPIADSVARFNPVTGAKNKLRKSYKGFINDLPGKNVVVTKASQTEQHAGDEPGGGNKMDLLGALVSWPEEEWVNQNVHGKELSKGLDMGKLRKGLTMSKGDIPGFDASILGLEEELRRKTPHAATTPAAAVGTPHVNGSTPGGASTVSGGAGGDDARPRRKKRRRYDEGSYEGYEQFDGEEDAPVNNGSGGNGSGGGGMMGGGGWNEEKKKKKRKKNPDMNSPSAGSVSVSGGMNMSHHAPHHGGISIHGSLYGR